MSSNLSILPFAMPAAPEPFRSPAQRSPVSRTDCWAYDILLSDEIQAHNTTRANLALFINQISQLKSNVGYYQETVAQLEANLRCMQKQVVSANEKLFNYRRAEIGTIRTDYECNRGNPVLSKRSNISWIAQQLRNQYQSSSNTCGADKC